MEGAATRGGPREYSSRPRTVMDRRARGKEGRSTRGIHVGRNTSRSREGGKKKEEKKDPKNGRKKLSRPSSCPWTIPTRYYHAQLQSSLGP